MRIDLSGLAEKAGAKLTIELMLDNEGKISSSIYTLSGLRAPVRFNTIESVYDWLTGYVQGAEDRTTQIKNGESVC